LSSPNASSSAAKFVSVAVLAARADELKRSGRTVVMCHGCFDILHYGHLRHFEAARQFGDVLVITVTPDRFVNKGPGRPIFSQAQRAELLSGLAAVDLVALNEWDSAVPAIQLIRPDVFVKGQEYEPRDQRVNPNFALEAAAMQAIGGRVAFTHEETSSSTAAVQRMDA
jgi:rfaE bifunctional protein nucleotidyltransferase chain/domain